jgi:glutamine synthetase
MLHGVTYAITNNKSQDDLLAELSKNPGDPSEYLEKARSYRSEEDVFEFYNAEEREAYFGKAPATVYENLCSFEKYPKKMKALQAGNVFNDNIINSYKLGAETRWLTEINSRIISNYADEIKSYKQLHLLEKSDKLDDEYWAEIQRLRLYIFKDTCSKKSLFTEIKDATESSNLEKVSELQIELDAKMKELREIYFVYSKNMLD